MLNYSNKFLQPTIHIQDYPSFVNALNQITPRGLPDEKAIRRLKIMEQDWGQKKKKKRLLKFPDVNKNFKT